MLQSDVFVKIRPLFLYKAASDIMNKCAVEKDERKIVGYLLRVVYCTENAKC